MEAKFQYYMQNHPDELYEAKERGEVSETEYFRRQVELGRSYQTITDSFALFDIFRFLETNKNHAIAQLLSAEEARKVRDKDNFKPDEYFKGVVLASEALQRHIQFRLDDLEDNLNFLKEAEILESQNTNE